MSEPYLDGRHLIELVRSVFPPRMEAPLPIVRTSTFRDDEVTALENDFAGVEDWTTLSTRFVDQAPDGWSSALAFLSNEAICFFLPAYLVADIAGKLTRADPVFTLTTGLDGRHRSTHAERGPSAEQHAQERWRRLTHRQCRAVVAYLRYKQFEQPHLQDTIAPALALYWLPRAA